MKNFTQKYPRIHHLLWDIKYFHYRFWLLLLISLAIITPIVIHFEKKEKEAYRKSKITFGIVDKINIGYGKGSASYIDFHFYNNKNELIKIETNIFVKEFELSRKCLYDRKIGDTVIVKYSLSDNQTAKIINCYWNDNLKKKYGFYKWN